MKLYTSCEPAIQDCLLTETFSIAHLSKCEKTKGMHIHNCYEIYYSISGGKQFIIDNELYPISPGDLFIINQFESHCISDADWDMHDRIILNIHPHFVKSLSTSKTNLNECFSNHPANFPHKISLSQTEQHKFFDFIDRLTKNEGYASDILEQAAIAELLVMINSLIKGTEAEPNIAGCYVEKEVMQILRYINQNISSQLTVEDLASHFYISTSYMCRIFKKITSVTVGQYIVARRIAIAKKLLSENYEISKVCEIAGFSDYYSLYRAFKKEIGISPKKYSTIS